VQLVSLVSSCDPKSRNSFELRLHSCSHRARKSVWRRAPVTLDQQSIRPGHLVPHFALLVTTCTNYSGLCSNYSHKRLFEKLIQSEVDSSGELRVRRTHTHPAGPVPVAARTEGRRRLFLSFPSAQRHFVEQFQWVSLCMATGSEHNRITLPGREVAARVVQGPQSNARSGETDPSADAGGAETRKRRRTTVEHKAHHGDGLRSPAQGSR